MSAIREFVKLNSIPLTAVQCSPYFDDAKNRVAKGNAVPHAGWKTKSRFEPGKANKTITGDNPTMWFMDLKKAGFFVIDVDVKGDKTAKDVILPGAWEELMRTCAYVVQTGSGGAHFYFKLPDLEEGWKVQQSIKDKRIAILDDETNADVDILTEQIIVEGSSYEFQNKLYKYTALQGSVNDVAYDEMMWKCVKPSILVAPRKKGEVSETLGKNLLERLVMNITNDESVDWNQWYKVAQAIFNEDGSEELFLRWSALSSKHNEKAALQQWKSLKKGDETKLTAGSIYYWSSLNAEKHEAIVLDCLPVENYQHQKVLFEKTHFKLMNPPCYIRHAESIQMLKDCDLNLMYQNIYYKKKVNIMSKGVKIGEDVVPASFIAAWKADVYIRTYDKIVFKPKQVVPKTHFNVFTDFPCEAVQGDCSVMNDLMWLLSGENNEVREYLECYFAHMIQKPYEKPGVALVFYSDKQGAGKDTPLDFIGKIVGEDYFYNTEDAENQVFGRFTEHLQKTIFLKMEEVEFETNKKNESALLSLITAPVRSYEGKGQRPITLDDYKRPVMTTNKQNPVSVPESDRRFVLINSSEKRVGDRAFWDGVYEVLKKPETKQAYYYYLLHKDISNFNVRERPITNFYKEVKTAQRPYHATYFQKWIALNGEFQEECEMTATDWVKAINADTKFPITITRFGLDMKKHYPQDCITKIEGRYNNSYKLHTANVHRHLGSKGWWAD
jgi:hypothetical protein